MAGNSRLSPRFLKARNEIELEKKLRTYQLVKSLQFSYINIYPTKDGVVAWFYESLTLGEAINGDEGR